MQRMQIPILISTFDKKKKFQYSPPSPLFYINPDPMRMWIRIQETEKCEYGLKSWILVQAKCIDWLIDKIPASFWTISLVCRFHIYTWLSSLPLTIHLPPDK